MKYFTLILFSLFISCAREKSSNFGVDTLEGVTLDGKITKLADIQAEKLALNVYSPTCVPCVKEIPVLNHLFREFAGKNGIRLMMVADPYLVVPDSEGMEEGEVIRKARQIMLDEVKSRKIELPILIMKKPFRVGEKDLVTGTPETLIFHTDPLVLYYNFIGSISEETVPEKITKDKKVAFFKKMLGY